MMHWFRTHPMVAVLLPLIGLIVCVNWANPSFLLRETEVPYIDSTRVFRVVVRDWGQPCAVTTRYRADILEQLRPAPSAASGCVYLYLSPDSVRSFPSYGDTLLVRTTVRRGQPLGNFDYGRYLRLAGIVGTAYVPRGGWWVQSSYVSRGGGSPAEWQHRLVERYRRFGIQEPELATLSALTLGQKEMLDDNQRQAFQRSGAAHILAVSGLHTGIIYSVLLMLVSLAGRYRPLYDEPLRRAVVSGVVIVALWIYAALTGLTPSVVRSVVMLSLLELCRISYRQPQSLNIVATAAVLILLFRPTDLFSVSFQLSFAAVVGIILLMPRWSVGWYSTHSFRRVGRWLVVGVRDILLVSLAAQLSVLPLTLYYFGQCSNYFLLTNLLVLPLTWCIVVSALLLLVLGAVPLLGVGLSYLTSGLVGLLNRSVQWLEHLPGAVTERPLSGGQVLLIYAILWGGWMCYLVWQHNEKLLSIRTQRTD